jgi:transposase
MKFKDARHLSPKAQEALRYRVVRAVVDKGMSQTEATQVFGVGRTAVYQWVKAYRQRGARALKAKKQGRRTSSSLAGYQAATVGLLIQSNTPEELGLPFDLWTRAAVGQLIEERSGICISVWTVGRYLKRWGMTPQKPVRRAYEQEEEEVKKWQENDYPEIAQLAQQEGAEIHWEDEMGLRSSYQAGASYSKEGQTPVVKDTGKRFGCNLISTLTNQGKLSFQVFSGNFNSEVMIEFLRRLIRQTPQKIFLLADRHPVHLSRKVNHWLEAHDDQIRMFLLPPFSPELNPDELLNHDIKANAVGRRRVRTQAEMVTNVRCHLHRRQQQPQVIRNFFREKHVRYAA